MTVHASPPPILDTAGVDADEALSILKTALAGADDGELFLERSESESLVFDDGRLKSAAYDATEGFGFVQSKPASALSPVLVTPESLGERFRDGKLHGELSVQLNGQDFGRADAGVDMTFDFGTLIAHLAKTRSLSAGTIIGSGTVSNRDADGGPGKPVAEGGLGYSCIAEVRTVETLLRGAAETPFLAHGDTVRIEMLDERRHSIFGAIEQTVQPTDEAG